LSKYNLLLKIRDLIGDEEQTTRMIAQKERQKKIEFLLEILRSLSCKHWKLMVKGQLFSYVFENERTSFENAKTLLRKYYKIEIISLLELALWKSCLCSHGDFSSLAQMKQYYLNDKTFDQTKYKKECRRKYVNTTILSLVLEFLTVRSAVYEVNIILDGKRKNVSI